MTKVHVPDPFSRCFSLKFPKSDTDSQLYGIYTHKYRTYASCMQLIPGNNNRDITVKEIRYVNLNFLSTSVKQRF